MSVDTLFVAYRFGIVHTTEYDDDPEIPEKFVEDLVGARSTDGFLFHTARHTETVTVDGVEVRASRPPLEVTADWEEAVEISFTATQSLIGIRSFEDSVNERWKLTAGPGTYRVLALAIGRNIPQPDDEDMSPERFMFHIWPSAWAEPITHKSIGFYYNG